MGRIDFTVFDSFRIESGDGEDRSRELLPELKKSEAKFRTLINQANDAILIETVDEEIVDANNCVCNLTGYSLNELRSMRSARELHPEDGYLYPMYKYGMYESVMKRKDGSVFPVELSVSPYTEGDHTLFISIIRDISDRKMAEELLRESEDRLIAQYNGIPVPTYTWQKSGSDFLLANFNDAAQSASKSRINGYKDKRAEELYEKLPDVVENIRLCFEKKATITQEMSFFYDPDGENKIVFARFAYVPPDRVLVHIEDITKRREAEEKNKKLQEQLFHAQKMESIGRLAGGIAHDFNNILTGMMGYTELLKARLDTTDEYKINAVNAILRGSEKAADLTKQLLGFARKGKFNSVPVNINSAIKDSIRVCEKIFDKNINLKFKFDRNLKSVEADRTQIDQVFTNLAINSKDAMPDGGSLIFKTENVSLNGHSNKNIPKNFKGDFVKISVSDTGLGIPDSYKNKIFDPFFTTKEEGKGTGLGLATVYGIINNHKGFVSCESEQGKGTSFTIYFPASKKRVVEIVVFEPIIKGNETILVVDDEEDVRESVKDQLRSLGYSTIEAEDGSIALKIFEKYKNQIDLILLDMIMPKMSGENTYKKLKNKFPQNKILLTSGYSKNANVSELLNSGAGGYIQKPYKLNELSRMINKLLT